jgi:hypothetical protein
MIRGPHKRGELLTGERPSCSSDEDGGIVGGTVGGNVGGIDGCGGPTVGGAGRGKVALGSGYHCSPLVLGMPSPVTGGCASPNC